VQTSLTSRVRSGLVWNSISVSSSFLVGFIRSIVLARILAPGDFGLFGMALTVLGGLSALTATGSDISVLSTKFQDDEELHKHLDTLWTMELIKGSLLTLALLAAAYPAARFYSDKRLYEILLLVSLMPLVQGFQNVGLVIFRKQVNFQRIAWLELATSAISAVASVALALWARNVWALIGGQLMSVVAGVAFSYALHPYRPRLAFDKEAARRALDIGKYAVLITVLNYLMTTADNILIGKLFGAVILGTYVIAYNLAALPMHALWVVVANVTWSAYAELSGGDVGRLERAFVRVLAAGSTLLAVAASLLMLLGGEIVVLLYGSKWVAAGTLLRLLSPFVFFRGLTLLISPLVRSTRGMASDAGIKAVEAAIFFALLYPLASKYGAAGAACALSVVYFITLVNRVRLVLSLLPGASGIILRTILSAVAAVGLGVALGASAMSAIEGVVPRLIWGGAVVSTVVVTSMLALSPQLRAEISQIFSTSSGGCARLWL
jgi:lipopolysaccharide exporter